MIKNYVIILSLHLQQFLEASGITDKETLAVRRSKIELEFHRELMTALTAKVDAYYAQTELPHTAESAAA